MLSRDQGDNRPIVDRLADQTARLTMRDLEKSEDPGDLGDLWEVAVASKFSRVTSEIIEDLAEDILSLIEIPEGLIRKILLLNSSQICSAGLVNPFNTRIYPSGHYGFGIATAALGFKFALDQAQVDRNQDVLTGRRKWSASWTNASS